MTTLYDSKGNTIEPSGGSSSEVTTDAVKKAFTTALANGDIVLGNIIGNTLGIDTSYFNSEYMDTAYASLLSAYKSYPNSIPFFIQSDEHGRGVEINRYANNIDVDGMEYVNINCGDTCTDTFNTNTLENIYARSKGIKNHIGTPGNHDYKVGSEEVSSHIIRKAFSTTNLERKMISISNLNCYVAYQPIHAVKYICLDLYDDRGIISGMPHPYVNKEVAEWLIDELTYNDGFDIVMIYHEPIMKTYKGRNDVNYTTATDVNGLYDLLLARKNKTNGTYVDDEGIEHTYDFTGTKSFLLCSLSGHWHEEIYSDNEGFTSYAQDWAGDNKYGGTFGLIDRNNNLVRIFSFDNVNGVLEELDILLQG